MKTPKLLTDADTQPFRFAVVFGAIVIVILLTSKSDAQENRGTANWTTSYQEAVAHAEQLDTPIMLVFAGSDWCPWCEKLTKEVFDKPEFAAWTEGRVVTIMLDFPRNKQLPSSLANQNNSLLDRYRQHLEGFPTALFIKADGTVIGKMSYEPDGILIWINKAQKIVGKLDKVA